MSISKRSEFHRYLQVRGAYSPSFNPDGARLAFLTDITGLPQAWAIDGAERWPEQLTFYDEPIGAIAYSPVRDELVFGMDAGGNERQQLFLLSDRGAEVRPLTDEPNAIHSRSSWAPDGTSIAYTANRRHPAHFDIYIQDVDEREGICVFEGEGTYAVSDWSPDGERLLVTQIHSNWDHDLYVLDAASAHLEHLTPQGGPARFLRARWAPDGHIYLLTDAHREFLAPAVLDPGTKRIELLDDTQWDAEELALSADGHRLAYALNVDGVSELTILDLVTRERARVEGLPPGVVGAPADLEPLVFSSDGERLAFSYTGARHNPDIWVFEVASGKLLRYTRSSLAGIPRDSLVEPQLVRYRSFDGVEVPAYLFLPAGAPRNLPVVVYVHGGPESQFRPTFNPVIQYLTRRGYAVFAPNVRGSTGYGKTYMHLDDVEKRMDAVADLKHGAEWLISSGYADVERLAVMGGSYGGFMVLAALVTYPELWAAGVDLVGIANFVTFLENTGPWRRRLREAEYGSLERDRAYLEGISPIHKIARIRAPLMVIHGANDPRVPIGEAEQIIERLEAQGQSVEFLRFEDEGHGIVKLENKLEAYPAIEEFLARYLSG